MLGHSKAAVAYDAHSIAFVEAAVASMTKNKLAANCTIHAIEFACGIGRLVTAFWRALPRGWDYYRGYDYDQHGEYLPLAEARFADAIAAKMMAFFQLKTVEALKAELRDLK